MTTPPIIRLRAMLGGSVAWVGAGLAVYGLSTYGYLMFAARALGAEPFAPLSTFWTLVNALAIGVFAPLEQEVSRSTAHRERSGGGNAGAVRTSLAYTALVLGVAALVALATAEWAAHRWFADQTLLVLLFLFAMAGQAAAYLARGLLSGSRRLRRYGLQFLVDGALRIGGALALLLMGADSVMPFAALLVLSPVLAVLLTSGRPSALVRRGEEVPSDTALRGMSLLLVASVCSQVLANAGPPTIGLLASGEERSQSGPFLAALVLARVPVFLFAAVQAVFLPALSRAVGTQSPARYRSLVRTVLAGTLVVSVLAVAACAAVGPEVVRAVFGSGFEVSRELVVLLAASGGAFMAALVLAQSLLALRAERMVAVAWAVGLLGYVVSLAVPAEVSLTVATALTAGSALAAGLMLALLRSAFHTWTAELEKAT